LEQTEASLGTFGDVIKRIRGLLSGPAGEVSPCSLKSTASFYAERYQCPKCCGARGGGEEGYFNFGGTAGLKVSCNTNGGAGLYVNVTGALEIDIRLSRKWDTCVPSDEVDACLYLKGSMSVSICTGYAAIGTRACMKLTIQCDAGYCLNHSGGSSGWSGRCRVYVTGEACLFFQCASHSFPPFIEFP